MRVGAKVMFCSTVMCGNKLNDWNTMPMSARTLFSAAPEDGSGSPRKVMLPPVMVSSRLMVRHSVDLPEPDGPITTTTSPLAMSRSMSRSTVTVPKDLVTPRIVISGVGERGAAWRPRRWARSLSWAGPVVIGRSCGPANNVPASYASRFAELT